MIVRWINRKSCVVEFNSHHDTHQRCYCILINQVINNPICWFSVFSAGISRDFAKSYNIKQQKFSELETQTTARAINCWAICRKAYFFIWEVIELMNEWKRIELIKTLVGREYYCFCFFQKKTFIFLASVKRKFFSLALNQYKVAQ